MKKATFFFRNGNIIVTQISESDDAQNIGQRMRSGGFIVGADLFWGESRKVLINLADVSCVIITKKNHDSN